MALACVLDASAAVRLVLADPAAADLADRLNDFDPQELLAQARELVDRLEPDRHLQAETLALTCHLNHPVYDYLSLALARREAASLISSDRRLNALAEGYCPEPGRPATPPTPPDGTAATRRRARRRTA